MNTRLLCLTFGVLVIFLSLGEGNKEVETELKPQNTILTRNEDQILQRDARETRREKREKTKRKSRRSKPKKKGKNKKNKKRRSKVRKSRQGFKKPTNKKTRKNKSLRRKKKRKTRRLKKIQRKKGGKARKCGRQNTTNAIDETCLSNLVNSISFERDQVTNFLAQYNRIKNFVKLVGNKAAKKGDFSNSTSTLLEALGGNGSNPACAGQRMTRGSRNAAVDSYKKLSNCSSTIETSCQVPNDTYSDTALGTCNTTYQEIKTKNKQCTTKTTNQDNACACWADAMELVNKAKNSTCDGKKPSDAVRKLKVACISTFSGCKKAEDASIGYIVTCRTCNASAGECDLTTAADVAANVTTALPPLSATAPPATAGGSDHNNFNEDPEQTTNEINTILFRIINKFDSLTNFPNFTLKGVEMEKWIKEQFITNITKISEHEITSGSTFTEQILTNVWNIFQNTDTQNEFETDLDTFAKGTLHQSDDDPMLHEMAHHVIEAAKTVSKFIKTKTQGGTDGLVNIWEAYVAHTDHANLTFDELKPYIEHKNYSNCPQCIETTVANSLFLNTIVGTAKGCNKESGLSGCAHGAKAGAINGIVSSGESVHKLEHDPSYTGGLPGCLWICFAGRGQVETLAGPKKISELVIGDFVRTSTGGQATHFTEFIGWILRQRSAPVEMLEIFTSPGHSSLTLTYNHIVYTSNSTKYADELQIGDSLMYWDGSQMVDGNITEIKKTMEIGSWSPLTRDGNLIVDGYLTSCYASAQHQISNTIMTPVRMMPSLLLDNEESQHKDGIRSVVKIIKKFGEWIGARERNFKNSQSCVSPLDVLIQNYHFNIKTEL